ncbi:ribonuclease E/G [Altererythrobacter sp. MF3-039]|uniref:Rne/Rng family ribonuclease n=1 Tax=Altererythrobacter sp. MF3-039 TaxID=3252901 RepID=UPI00390C5FA2
MSTRMLIDARHSEETRVAVLKGNRIEEFDFESADHKQIKGNIYLAKVTRVEPSLQAAFVDFGGNRHGFLAFSEIHPDYYQIPQSDREALLAEEAAHAEEEAKLRAEEDDEDADDNGDDETEDDADDDGEDEESSEALAEDLAEGDEGLEEIDTSEKDDVATIEEGHVENGEEEELASEEEDEKPRRSGRGRRQGRGRKGGRGKAKKADELRSKRMELRRRYKIQDVIQRRQVLLVQVVKEERGNKGAALTTYLSLAGRYCVLMPNSSHGGGISRKISNSSDRKRLKQIVSDLSLPKTMGLIVRTAGLSRTKPEIKRDFDYLARLWDEIRERTLSSTAPSLIHSDSDLIKRAIRDIYNREIEEVVVEGEDGYKAAKQFMKLLMPSHARRVKAYSDPVPLFQRYGAEDQLRAMYDPEVQLKSGGYLVINPTEALVSIDINSGRSTKEHGIEQTAVATNIEAAREIARQLRLRDMAGLVVIDFIDMDYSSNIRKVERAMKDALKNDRARIQIGRISSFGLMEMSRQRLRTGVLEATTRECPHCDGTGLVRTASSAGLSALRLIEDEAAKGRGSVITLSASTEAAIYMLNSKRADLREIEERYAVAVEVIPEGEDEGAKMSVRSSGPRPTSAPKFEPIVDDQDDEDEIDDNASDFADDDDDRPKKRKRRRRGGRGRNKKRPSDSEDHDRDDDAEDSAEEADAGADEEDKPKKRRRRGGRGRRGKGKDENVVPSDEDAEAFEEVAEQVEEDMPVVGTELPEPAPSDDDEEKKPKKKRAPRKKKVDSESAEEATPESEAEEEAAAKPKPKRKSRAKKAEAKPAEAETDIAEEKPARKPRKATAKKAAAKEAESATATEESSPEPVAEPAKDSSDASGVAPRRGWWQRTFGEES